MVDSPLTARGGERWPKAPENSVTSIARLLGVSRSTLYKYLPELSGGRAALPQDHRRAPWWLLPFAYCGGKSRLAARIAVLLPEYAHYVEPFAGGLSVLLAKTPSRMKTVNVKMSISTVPGVTA
ncbi:DNA adenine methylase [Actinopolyspora saharensis]|uniref:DNA adenine methylase n=1 Tax=Actinopolyspora saharensis TaxID=995062 RepID=UPI003F662E07